MAKKAAKSEAKPKAAKKSASKSQSITEPVPETGEPGCVSSSVQPLAAVVKSESRVGDTGNRTVAKPIDEATLENRTQEVGRELFGRLKHRAPSIFHGRWWEDRLMSWAMSDESVKVQMFRFVDVLPMLKDHNAIARQLDDYFE